jgi:glycosyltransferase involved in cell wall biosynthesis
MSPTPLLFVDHAPALGGAERSLLLLLKHLNRDLWQPHLACPAGILAEEAQRLGVQLHLLEMPRLRRSAGFPLQWLLTASRIAQAAKQCGAVLIHSNTIRSTVYAVLAAKLARRPLVWHMRDFWLSEMKPDKVWLDWWVKRLICSASTEIIVNSKATATHIPCEGRATVIYNGIEADRYSPPENNRAYRRRLGIPEDKTVVGMMGRLRPWKGQEVFLRAAARINRSVDATCFLVVGGDPFQVDDGYADRLRAITASLELTEQVIFTGHLEDVRPALAAMDIFVHPGSPEPFGLVNIEAMAMARPVVAFAHGALPEIVQHGVTGLLVAPNDVEALASAILELQRDPVRAQMMGLAGKRRVSEHFTIQQTAAQVESLYQHILDNT